MGEGPLFVGDGLGHGDDGGTVFEAEAVPDAGEGASSQVGIRRRGPVVSRPVSRGSPRQFEDVLGQFLGSVLEALDVLPSPSPDEDLRNVVVLLGVSPPSQGAVDPVLVVGQCNPALGRILRRVQPSAMRRRRPAIASAASSSVGSKRGVPPPIGFPGRCGFRLRLAGRPGTGGAAPGHGMVTTAWECRSLSFVVGVPVSGRSGVRAFRCPGVPASGRSGVRAFRHLGVVSGCSGVRVSWCRGVPAGQDVPASGCPGVGVFRRQDVRRQDVPASGCPGVGVFRHLGVPAGVQDVPVSRRSGVRACH